MQVSYSKNKYKAYELQNKPVKQRFFKHIFNSSNNKIYPLLDCFNQYSVIENFLQSHNYYLQKSIDKLDINHKRKEKPLILKTVDNNDFIDLNFIEFNKYLDTLNNTGKFAVISNSQNDVKYFRLLNRFEDGNNRNISDLSFGLDNYKGSGVFLTLTYNHNKSVKDTWLSVSHDWHVFNSRLLIELKTNHYNTKLHIHKNKSIDLKQYYNDLQKLNPAYDFDNDNFDLDYNLTFDLYTYKNKSKIYPCYPNMKKSDLKYIMVLEAQQNGYPHIHVLYLGIDFLFYAGNKIQYNNDNIHSKNLKHIWGKGSVFVNKTKSKENIRNPIKYMFKYIRKTWSKPNSKSLLTQSMLWYFNLNSFNTSKHLKEYLNIPKNHNIPYSLYYKPKDIKLFFDLDYLKIKDKTFKLQSINIYKKLSGQYTPVLYLDNLKYIDKHNNMHKYKNHYSYLDKSTSFLEYKLKYCVLDYHYSNLKFNSKIYSNPLNLNMDLSIFLWNNNYKILLENLEYG